MFSLKKIIYIIKNKINILLSFFSLRIISVKMKGKYNKNDINLNIGSGWQRLPYFTNLDRESEWYTKSNKDNKFILYDFSKAKLPFKDNVASNIYCSHVIEHALDVHVKKLFSESLRVLKKNGVFRITCPDAKFLYEVSVFENEYWNWYRTHNWMGQNPQDLNQYDYLTFHICRSKLRFNNPKPTFEKLSNEDLKKNEVLNKKIKNLDYLECMKALVEGATVTSRRLGDHRNYFDFEKIKEFLDDESKNLNINKYKVIRSVPHGSVSQLMSESCFDDRYEQSLFVDYVKLS